MYDRPNNWQASWTRCEGNWASNGSSISFCQKSEERGKDSSPTKVPTRCSTVYGVDGAAPIDSFLIKNYVFLTLFLWRVQGNSIEMNHGEKWKGFDEKMKRKVGFENKRSWCTTTRTRRRRRRSNGFQTKVFKHKNYFFCICYGMENCQLSFRKDNRLLHFLHKSE